MAGKVKADFTTTSWNFIAEELRRIQQKVGDDLDRGLEEATDYLADKLALATPIDTGKTKDSWKKEKKYRFVKYIFNTSVNNRGIPIVNLLEYSKSKGKPFVRKTVDHNVEQIEKIIRRAVEESKDNG